MIRVVKYLLFCTFFVISWPKTSWWLLQGSSSTIRLKASPNWSASTWGPMLVLSVDQIEAKKAAKSMWDHRTQCSVPQFHCLYFTKFSLTSYKLWNWALRPPPPSPPPTHPPTLPPAWPVCCSQRAQGRRPPWKLQPRKTVGKRPWWDSAKLVWVMVEHGGILGI